jgi:hypothetical protein
MYSLLGRMETRDRSLRQKKKWILEGNLVPPAGLEPAAPRLGISCSIRLSYGGFNDSLEDFPVFGKIFLMRIHG